MNVNFEACLEAVLKHEGGYSDHPSDPGGATNKGITLETYQHFKGSQYVTKAQLKTIPDWDVSIIYRRMYWDKVNGDKLPLGLDYAVFDFAVNSGPGRAVKVLQGLLNVPRDGAIGQETLKKIAETDMLFLINSYRSARHAFLIGLTTFGVFGKGWTRRVEDVEQTAIKMVG